MSLRANLTERHCRPLERQLDYEWDEAYRELDYAYDKAVLPIAGGDIK